MSISFRALLTLAMLGFTHAASALTVTSTNDANTLANTLLGPGVTLVGTPTYTGGAAAVGTFSGGVTSGIGIESGIILTTGTATDAVGPNKNANDAPPGGFDDTRTDLGQPGNSTLTALAGSPTFDAAILAFNFSTTGGNLFFNYVFASEEYDDFVNAGYNDTFAFFLDGVNIALIPGTSIPVSVDNVNAGTHASLYTRNNNPATFDIEYDGFTAVLAARAFGIGAGTHTIQLAIADAGDAVLDSAVFIQAGFFSDTATSTTPEPGTFVLLGSGLLGILAYRTKKVHR